MVFESIVADLLNRFLGDYVENLDRSQLKIGIWGGDVVLQNLILKQSALDELDLPVKTVYGHLGKLVLKIPWKNLYSAPVEASIERLFLLAVPNQDVKYDSEKEEKYALESKLAELQRVEDAKKREKEKDQPKAADTFVEKLATQIIKNVQIKIQDIHIRYEDRISIPYHPFAVGLTMHNLSVHTTDENWKECIVQDECPQIHKVLNLEGLAVYWNPRGRSFPVDKPTVLLDEFSKTISTKDRRPEGFLYMLGPINSFVRLRLNPKPELDRTNFKIPKVWLHLELDRLAIGISKEQYANLIGLIESFGYMIRGSPYRKYRPNVPKKGHAKEWWKFAYTCILEEEVRRKRQNWDWNCMLQHRILCRKYAKAYHTKLTSKKVPADVQEMLAECERLLDVLNIVLVRQKVEVEVERMDRKMQETKQQASWFSGWFSGGAAKKEEPLSAAAIVKKFEEAMTPEEKAKLYRAIDYQENSAPTQYPKTFNENVLRFQLKILALEVRDDTYDIPRVLYSELCGVSVEVKQRPSAQAIKVVSTVDHLTIYGLKQGTYTPELVSSKELAEESVLLNVLFETNPIDETCDQRLHVKNRPLQIVYDAVTINKVVDVFQTPKSEGLSEIQAVAGSRLTEFREMSATGLQHAIDMHQVLDLKIELSSSYAILPHGGIYKGAVDLLVVNFGNISMRSVPRDPSQNLNLRELVRLGTKEEDVLKIMASQSYDKFIIELKEMQILTAPASEDWRSVISNKQPSPLHILQPTSLTVNFENCLVTDDPRLPKIKIAAHLPNVTVTVIDQRLIDLLSLINSVPFPNSDEVEMNPPLETGSRTSSSSVLSHYKDLTDNLKRLKEPAKKPKSVDPTLIQATELQLNFVMDELKLVILKQVEQKPEILMDFSVISVEVELIQQTFDMTMTARLGGIVMVFHDESKDVRLLDTPMAAGGEEYMFVVKFISVNRRSPEFKTKHNSVLQLVLADFTQLSALLHQESLLALLEFGNEIQSHLERVVPKTATGAPSRVAKRSTLEPILEDGSSRVSTKKQSVQKKTGAEEIIDFKLKANIRKLDVSMANRQDILAEFSLEGVTVGVTVKKSCTDIAAKLKDITVIDPHPKILHHKILSIVGVEAMSVAVVMYNLTNDSSPDSVDMSVKAQMACIRVVFLNRFVMSILGFLSSFQAAQKVIAEAAAEAAEAARQNMQQAYAKASRMSLDIDIKAPVILVPQNSASLDALFMDFGNLTVKNKFETLMVKEGQGHNPVIDEMQVGLQNMKMCRVTLDESGEVLHECVLLEPISFMLIVRRNLSASWFKQVADIDMSGRLKTIKIKISQEDYNMMLKVASENLAEGEPSKPVTPPQAEHTPPAQPSVDWKEPPPTAERSRIIEVGSGESRPSLEPSEAVTAAVRFTFTMDSLIIELFTGGTKKLEETSSPAHLSQNGLARFTMHVLSLKGHLYSDGSLSTSLLLVDCLLDDTRAGRENMLTRLMERTKADTSDTSEIASTIFDPTSVDQQFRSMVDVTFQLKGSDMFVDVRIYGFNLVLSPDFLLKVAAFFAPIEEEIPEVKPKETPGASQPQIAKARSKASHVTMKTVQSKPSQTKSRPPQEKEDSRMTINLRVEKPDIILLENIDDPNSNALVLNNEVIFKLRLSKNHMVMSGSLKDLQLYACCYSKRKDTISQILRPCSISLAGSTPAGEGLHIDVCVSDIRIRVSPATIELLSKIQTAMVPSEIKEGEGTEAEENYSEIWKPANYEDDDFWFLRTEEGEDAVAFTKDLNDTAPALGEICMISAPSIVVTVEAGVSNQTLPMILLELGFQGSVNNWSSQLHVECGLNLRVSYYNSVLALWEPLVEPVETIVDGKTTHTPWELTAQIQMNKQQPALSPVTSVDDVIDIPVQPPALTIDISSKDNLEVTVTKTCLEVLMNLGKAFEDAYKQDLASREAAVAPYLVENDTGMAIALLLEESHFHVQNKSEDGDTDYKEVMLENGAKVGLCFEDERDQLLVSASVSNLETFVEHFLVIKVIERNCKLSLPVTRADKRYFSLQHRGEGNDVWGLVSDVQVKDGGTIITLRSIIQVFNYFHVPVNVYYMTKRGNELECVGTVAPREKINLPLYAVYTPTSELFFSVEGYTVSVVPFVWKELQNMLTTTKILQCEPKDKRRKEPFFMKIVGEMEQVYFEKTSRFTMMSSCYNINLRPAVVVRNFLPVDVICCLAGTAVEKDVKAGERVQMPTAEPGVCSIVFRIPDYLEKEWSCKHELEANVPEFAVWTFESYDSAQRVSMDLGIHSINKFGSLVMSLYCPFWMLNKTGLMLSYRKSHKSEKRESSGSPMKPSDDTANILYHPDDFKGPVLFSFKAKSFFGKKKASIKVEDGEWSDKFSLDVAGSSGVIDCKFDGVLYKVGISIQLTYSTLTKQVTFTPYYVLINNSKIPIECQEASRPADPWFKVEPEGCCAFWPRDTDTKNLRARVVGTTEVTAPFSYNSVYTVLLRLDNKYGGINVDIQMTEGAVYISFMSYGPGCAPALIINHTPVPISFSEKGSENSWTLEPKYAVMFTWANPLGPRELVWLSTKKKEVSDGLRKDGLGEFSPDPETPMYWVSFLDGMQRVLLFTADPAVAREAQSAGELEAIEREVNVAIHGVGLSVVNNISHIEILYIGIASSGVVWEARKPNSKRFKPFTMKESQIIEKAFQYYTRESEIGNSPNPRAIVDPKTEIDFQLGEMIRPHKRFLRRVFQTGLWIQIRNSAHQQQLHAKVNRIQIDNQMHDCVFPVILAPTPLPKSVVADNAWKPFAEVSVVRRIMEHSPVNQFKYFKVLIQEFHVKIDIGFVNSILEMFQAEELTVAQETQQFNEDRKLVDQPLLAHVTLKSSTEQKHFFDLLHFSPLKIHLSFSLSGGGGQGLMSSQDSAPHFLSVLLQGLGVTLTDMQDVIFKLAYFERQYTFLTQQQLISEVSMHYVGQSVKQLYVLVLGLDVIGNPYGLVLGFTQGVEDLFYEPFQGAIQGPGEFAEGLVLGVRSLFGHTVGGAAGAMSRITGAMGKGIAALTFDKEYQRKRREAMNRPANVQMGLAQSGKGLVMGVVDGVSGVFMKPISGAREEGVEGFFKGVGKGMVGLVARPTAGVIDFASGSLDAVKRVTDMSDEVTRLRPPRFLQPDGLVRPYVRKEAEGNKLLQNLEKGRYASTDVYAYHEYILDSGKEVLLLTDKRVMYIVHNDIFGGWQVEWDYTWDMLSVPPIVVEKGVFISVGEPKKKVFGMFGSDKGGKLILIKEDQQKHLIVNKIKELMTSS
ncbi:intermembrane lipid transfer protein Vps13 [Anabrus simplex]|uniref:intermembrane lipid transfer protein Vps13 n=1 Tax=Anabrus simplex TaxID=316456 RepID=UPI0035A315AB